MNEMNCYKGPSLDSFVRDQRKLLELERQEEISQSELSLQKCSPKDLVQKGVALDKLRVSGTRTGLYGKTVVSLSSHKDLPAHNITPGDIVSLRTRNESNPGRSNSGIVTSVQGDSIQVAFEDSLETLDLDQDARYEAVKLANDVTYRRLKKALDDMEGKASRLRLTQILFGGYSISPPVQSLSSKIADHNEIRFINSGLDESQKEAVKFALLQQELAVIHGPPGTGKTTTIVETITQAVKSGNKILCCAPSNIAVDNMLERLIRNKVKVVRLGHPARVNRELQKHSLDALLSFSDQTKLVRDVRNDIDKALAKLKKAKGKGERFGHQKDLKELRKELRQREKDAIKEILKNAEVVLSTLTTASPDGALKNVPDDHFDLTVIDECSQSLELACWIALPFGKKTILAGDHLQLPPTIMSTEAAKKGLELTLMERIIKIWPSNEVVRMLQTQYRMNSLIMDWCSSALYEGRLKAAASVAGHLLKDLPEVCEDDNTSIPLVLIDTTGCDMFELETPDEVSKANEGEVGLVCIHVQSLIEAGLKPEEIAVITPYNLQVELIRLQLLEKYPGLEVRSVDGFQGREKEAVVLSLVRANPNGEVGFLSESRRLNVAVTRARRHVAVICNAETVSHDPFLKNFIGYLEKHGDIRSAMQYQNELDDQDLERPEGLELLVKDEDIRENKKAENKKQKKNKNKNDKSDKISEKPKQFFKEKTTREELEGRTQTKRDEFETVLNQFLSSEREKHEFPCGLNSHDRLLVHEIAENIGLNHESIGEGKARRIVVTKIKKRLKSPEKAQPKIEPDKVSQFDTIAESLEDIELEGEDVIEEMDVIKESDLVPKANLDLKEMHKLRSERAAAKVKVDIPPVKSDKKASKKANKKVKNTVAKIKNIDEEDLDKLLDTFQKLDNVCNFAKCKEKITMLGVTCQFCGLRFCLNHSMPEIHGCGDMAKKAARQQISREGKLYAGSGKPDHRPDPEKRARMQRKLDKKLNDLEGDRARKPSKAKK